MLGLIDGDTDDDGLILGETDKDAEGETLLLALGETDALVDGETLELPKDGDMLGETDGEVDGLSDSNITSPIHPRLSIPTLSMKNSAD